MHSTGGCGTWTLRNWRKNIYLAGCEIWGLEAERTIFFPLVSSHRSQEISQNPKVSALDEICFLPFSFCLIYISFAADYGVQRPRWNKSPSTGTSWDNRQHAEATTDESPINQSSIFIIAENTEIKPDRFRNQIRTCPKTWNQTDRMLTDSLNSRQNWRSNPLQHAPKIQKTNWRNRKSTFSTLSYPSGSEGRAGEDKTNSNSREYGNSLDRMEGVAARFDALLQSTPLT